MVQADDSNELVPIEPGTLLSDPNDKMECDLCGLTYTAKYLAYHKRKVHGVYGGKSGKPRTNSFLKCLKCGNSYVPEVMWDHMRKVHGIFGGKSSYEALLLNPNAPVPTMSARLQPMTIRKVMPPRQDGDFKIMPFVVLESSDGAIWIAEKIRDAT